MKVGDLVKIMGSLDAPSVIGTIVAPWKNTDWWEILASNGMVIQWPESQLEVINETDLSR